MNRYVNTISGRLSLRPPQRRALEILDHVMELVPFTKQADPAAALAAIRAEYPEVTDFERDFPSLCFALATGVGKTRLMGAFIAYLHLVHGMSNFFVLAPNLTIYSKLTTDFTPGTPKYVFTGLGEVFPDPPVIVTGETYETGLGVRSTRLLGQVFVNIFNISKINRDVQSSEKAKEKPRIKRLREYIGQSYFDYLAGLDDLVLLMDESHRYRGSAGVKVLNELRPVLGLELTATPQTEDGKRAVPFKNVIYRYPLAQAMEDGFVKEPAVATRESFNPRDYSAEQLERLKLEDGIRLHENTKVELAVYARQTAGPLVKPFLLVVAADTTHAGKLEAAIKSDEFFDGRYKDKVITVHSNQRGEEKDETVEQLLTVERPDNKTEIVIHVNMLKEGWDVTNLYTIVPLRAADSRTLVEQSIGRGLRLPYGKRVGVEAVDRLTIVAHDKFQAIIDEAKKPGSPLHRHLHTVYIDREIGTQRRQVRTVPPRVLEAVARGAAAGAPAGQGELPFGPAERQVAEATLVVLRDYERQPQRVPLAEALTKPEIRQEIADKVAARLAPAQGTLPGMAEVPDVPAVVKRTLEWYVMQTITMPRIVVVPTGAVTTGYDDFDLDPRNTFPQPVPQDILIQHLRTGRRELLSAADTVVEEACLEDYLVRALIDFDDIDYEAHADLLYKLAGQMVTHLRSYLQEDAAIRNVLLYHEKHLAALVHAQMQEHRWERAAAYEVQVSQGFQALSPIELNWAEGEKIHDFRDPVAKKQDIPRMLFGGFARCLYPFQKFSSGPERLFAVLLEREPERLEVKWFKPARGQFKVFYAGEQKYEPDFVVETATEKYLCEPKRKDEMTAKEVLAKAHAAAAWCQHATDHELAHGGKPWTYLLIPHDAINERATLKGLAARYTYQAPTANAAALAPA